jgi:secondary thiamine-phosphate synthase enzyme
MMQTLNIQTETAQEMRDITDRVQQCVREAGVADGLCVVYVPHTTAGVTINEGADPDVRRDMLMELNKIVPLEDGYRHAEGNSAAHLKASFFGTSATLIIKDGRLILGRWQSIYLCEFDGPRQREVLVRITP